MKRRTFFSAAAVAGLAGQAAAAPAKKAIMELTYIRMRNNEHQQNRRTRDFLTKSMVPAMKRAGIGPIGLFSNMIGPDSPTILMLASYPGLSEMETLNDKWRQDEKFTGEAEAFQKMAGIPFQRIEKVLLRGFDSMPGVEVGETKEGAPSRLFEMRMYESNTFLTLRSKMGMFDGGEIDIFRKYGLQPVFFGETIVGPKMPNLTYMVAYDNWAEREKAWGRFVRSPEWQKLSKTPGLSDAEIVSNISNGLYRPLPGSDIR
jgi:NIPSNAP protein